MFVAHYTLYAFFLRPSEARWVLERTLGEGWRGVREPSSPGELGRLDGAGSTIEPLNGF
jgi:hypothetical protein